MGFANIIDNNKKKGKKAKKSKQNRLNMVDMRQWAYNTLQFSSPALITFIVALQSGISLEIALGMLYQAFLAALLGLLKKFRAGN